MLYLMLIPMSPVDLVVFVFSMTTEFTFWRIQVQRQCLAVYAEGEAIVASFCQSKGAVRTKLARTLVRV